MPLYGNRPPGSIAGCTEWILACIRDGALNLAELITDRVYPRRRRRPTPGCWITRPSTWAW